MKIIVQVLGEIYEPGFDKCATEYVARDIAPTLASVEGWMALNASDFARIDDYRAATATGYTIRSWDSPDSERLFDEILNG